MSPRFEGMPGLLEYLRTVDIIGRHLPPPPAAVADIGGGPGRYTTWLAELGYHVHHRDLVPLHVEQAAAATAAHPTVDTAIGDAIHVDLPDSSVDAVLLLGPVYHLPSRTDRLRALREAARIVRPDGHLFVAAISRWAPRIRVLTERLYTQTPGFLDELGHVERTGELRPVFEGAFNGYTHRPAQLRSEVRVAGLTVLDIIGVEGPGSLLRDLDARLQDGPDTAVVLDTARALERVPELIGLGPHLIAIATRPASV